ncbi:hypothetical protein AB0L75_40580 [Streptomyces sp. NPDC052101]|uniref:ATP-grasp domain-containing protein n=1 Tax=Streptomyces sp. NPDC052101 TaxID=3155763 RepID=UPI00341EE48E
MKREHVVLLDRSGYNLFRHPDGRPFLDPDRYRVTLVTLPGKVDQVRPGEVETVHAINVLDEAEVLGLLPVVRRGRPVDRVVAVSERLLVMAAQFRDTLGVPGFTTAQMLTLRDKVAMKRHVATAGVRVPKFCEIDRAMDAADLLARHGRIILKPRAGMGSVGVHKVSSPAELRALDAGGFSFDGAYEAEEFIDGDMYHIDSLVADGRPLVGIPSLYLDSNESFPVGGQNRTVVIDPGPHRHMLEAFNRQVLATLPWFSGVTHLEVFVGRDAQPVFCEVAGRPGGGGIVPAFQHRFGIDLHLMTALPQLGRSLPELHERQPAQRRHTGTAVFYPPALGEVVSFESMPERDWIVKFTALKKVGDVLKQALSVGQGVAEVTVSGPDFAAVCRRIEEVQSLLSLTVLAKAPAQSGGAR